jgi:hypothetical protein
MADLLRLTELRSVGAIRSRTAGLRPAAASPARDALDNPKRIDEPDVLRFTEPRSGILKGCEKLAGG